MRTGFVAVVAVAALSFQAHGVRAATVLTGFDSGGFRFIQDGTSNTVLFGEETRFSACFAQVTWPAGGPAIVDGTSNTIAFAEFPDGPVLAGRVVPTQPVGGIVDGTSNTIFLGEIGNDVCLTDARVIGVEEIEDGTSNTILIGEEALFDVCFRNAQLVLPGAISDGTSNTILIGESGGDPLCFTGVRALPEVAEAAVPEPAGWLLVGAGLLGLAGVRAVRRRRAR